MLLDTEGKGHEKCCRLEIEWQIDSPMILSQPFLCGAPLSCQRRISSALKF